jgi:hypothetical protein
MKTQSILVAVVLLFCCAFVSAQEPEKPAEISPHTRLMAARSIYVEHSGASIPFDIIGDAFQGWGRYQLADTPASADLIVSIVGPSPNPRASAGPGGKDRPAPANDFTQIRLLILDAHDRAVLWSGSEQPKAALNEKRHEDQLVDASLRLFRRFRDIIEPEPAP